MSVSELDNQLASEEVTLTAKMEPFDSYWQAPENVEKGYASFRQFYRCNYLKYLPEDKQTRILVISCGPGYFVALLNDEGYDNVLGIDSDPEKVQWARQKDLNCRVQRAFPFLATSPESYDLIVCEQELNHLTKDETLEFLSRCRRALAPGGSLLVYSLNGANPVTGAEALAQNFDHYSTFTEYSLKQVLEHGDFQNVRVFPLKLYVFYKNPLNYVGWLATGCLHALFRVLFRLYGKSAGIFTKKIGAVGTKPPGQATEP